MTNIEVWIDGVPRRSPPGVTVAAALLRHGITAFRRDGHGAPRAPLCGMGSCFECRVTIDEIPERRACLVMVRDGMHVDTGA